jgi:hypothetical protein
MCVYCASRDGAVKSPAQAGAPGFELRENPNKKI